MSLDDERPESDIRKRAAWLLAMLAVVAGLFVLLSVTLFHTSGGGGTDHGTVADPAGVITDEPSPSSSPGSSGDPSPSGSSGSASPNGSSSATSSAPVPTPSCDTDTTCTVRGDVAGAMSAINAYRAEKGEKPVPTSGSAAADKCALTSGSDCPSSFVWVRVTDLSGQGVVDGVTRYNSSDDLLDNSATSYEVGWAYDPGSKSTSCALIRRR